MPQISQSEEQARVNEWLRRLQARIGLALQLDAAGLCAIGHESGLDGVIEVPNGHDTVYLRIPLLPWPQGDQPHVLAEFCLQAHFLGVQTGGGCFAIDRDEAELVLWSSRPVAALDEDMFFRWLIQLLDAAAEWKQKLEEAYRTASVHLEEADPAGRGFA